MPVTLQSFLAQATQKSADELVKAFLHLPEEKRTWSPEATARNAVDQIAECAVLNGYTAHLIEKQSWPITSFDQFFQDKAAAAALEWERLHHMLQENTRLAISAISATPDEVLQHEIAMPWGNQTLAEILSYPFWNMSYHQGQITYIASLLGPLS